MASRTPIPCPNAPPGNAYWSWWDWREYCETKEPHALSMAICEFLGLDTDDLDDGYLFETLRSILEDL